MTIKKWRFVALTLPGALLAALFATSIQGQVPPPLPVPLPPPPALNQLVYPDINRLGLLDCQGGPTAGTGNAAAPIQVGGSSATCAQYAGFPLTNAGRRNDLIAFGKALFWDMRVGSDGTQACATCHFHAGADNRKVNQLSPGLNRVSSTNFQINAAINPSALTAAADKSLNAPGANGTLSAVNFPLAVPTAPGGNDGATGAAALSNARPFGNNDVVSSQGVALRGQQPGAFDRSTAFATGRRVDTATGTAPSDAPFVHGSVNIRRVEPRNTPTSIGAGFNFRNFWDGRANQFFNGVNPFGMLDPAARIHQWNGSSAVPVQVMVPFSSLASQAVGPPGSDFEMSLSGRGLADVGRKLLTALPDRPLDGQKVLATDSALGTYACTGAPKSGCETATPGVYRNTGLSKSYRAFIQDIFQSKYWSGTLPDGTTPLIESNFALFFGLAVQAYEATLVPDETPIDPILAFMTPLLQQAVPLTSDQALAAARNACATGGISRLTVNAPTCQQLVDELTLFLNPIVAGAAPGGQTGSGCAVCHVGAEFTGATVSTLTGFGRPVPAAVAPPVVPEAIAPIERMVFADGNLKVYDSGFYNIGVRPTADDLSIFGRTPGDVPFSIGMLMQEIALNNPSVAPVQALLASGSLLQPSAATGYPNFTVDLTPRPVTTFVPACAPRGAGRSVGLVAGNGCQPVGAKEPIGIRGSFKTSTLRNVKYMGPHFHNGGRATLRDVIQAHYNAGGIFNLAFNPQNCRVNRQGVSTQAGCLAGQVDFDPGIVQLNLSTSGPIGVTASSGGRIGDQFSALAHLIEFGLTDPRVARQKAPFDHPQLCVPVGHNADGSSALAEVPAVGAAGGDELQTFLALPGETGTGTANALVPGSCTMPLTSLGYVGAGNAPSARVVP